MREKKAKPYLQRFYPVLLSPPSQTGLSSRSCLKNLNMSHVTDERLPNTQTYNQGFLVACQIS
jgi:hypothetical protein